MNFSAPLAGYILMVFIIMFGGRRRRTFTDASQAAAGMIITLLFVGGIVWFLSLIISQLMNPEN
jgi:cell shape-determining protein MreD